MTAVLFGVIVVLLVSAFGVALALRRGTPSFRRTKEFPIRQLDRANPLVQQFIAELRALDSLSIESKQDRKHWYAVAVALQQKLRHEYSEFYESLPPELDHYFSDADIRAEEPEYAERQKASLAPLLER